MSTTSEFLLADARAALRRRVADAGRKELSKAFAAWLLDYSDTGGELVALVRNAATREGALQDFPTVAILGFGADAGISGPEHTQAFKQGLRRQAGREVVIDGLPVAFCSDMVGILGVLMGTKTLAETELTDLVLKWTSKFLKNTYDSERTDDWQRCLLAAADRQLGSPLNLSLPKSPATADVRTAFLARGVIDTDGPADEDREQTLALAMRDLPDELACDRAAVRLAAVESVIRGAEPLQPGTLAPKGGKRGHSLSERDSRVHKAVGRERFYTLTNAEIMRAKGLKETLRAEGLIQGADAARRCLDRIREAERYPLSSEITKKRATQN
ncbi:MAG: hypothetical protein ACR2IV_12735 [Bryobacteraceae bacterium]